MERTPQEGGPDRVVDEQAEAAASEAAEIGGAVRPSGGDEDENPAREAVEQAGGGEAEGFEQAERDLEEAASHGDPAPDPARTAFPAEEESGRSTLESGEPDEADPRDS